MNRLVLGNAAYRKLPGICGGHTTSEGGELQDGLVAAGWSIAGKHFNIYGPLYFKRGRADILDDTRVDLILKAFEPDVVFVQDPRDMQRENGGCFDKWTHFENLMALANYPAFKIVSFKDAGTGTEYQQWFARSIGANALACYYHDESVLKLSPWAKDYKRIRMYHSVDGDVIDGLEWKRPRMRGIVTGHAQNKMIYPLRMRVFKDSRELGISQMKHPGYHNQGCATPDYLEMLTRFKVHVATSSAFHFALRKIIESVCCGCACITNLPAYDHLPVIDEWLLRIPDQIGMDALKTLIDIAEEKWNETEPYQRARAAIDFYDYRAAGKRLDIAIRELMEG